MISTKRAYLGGFNDARGEHTDASIEITSRECVMRLVIMGCDSKNQINLGLTGSAFIHIVVKFQVADYFDDFMRQCKIHFPKHLWTKIFRPLDCSSKIIPECPSILQVGQIGKSIPMVDDFRSLVRISRGI
jgi:hypothetical protein